MGSERKPRRAHRGNGGTGSRVVQRGIGCRRQPLAVAVAPRRSERQRRPVAQRCAAGAGPPARVGHCRRLADAPGARGTGAGGQQHRSHDRHGAADLLSAFAARQASALAVVRCGRRRRRNPGQGFERLCHRCAARAGSLVPGPAITVFSLGRSCPHLPPAG
ncbi:conserved hypothetical protein [Ricinus communis]|uniref:Uncharacterized protein n=1 Tax=Ricinus communis TaxID=3988 RepID=B9TLD5_RICCO|nr:conserved hypothetical protein [Ricinus communis]